MANAASLHDGVILRSIPDSTTSSDRKRGGLRRWMAAALFVVIASIGLGAGATLSPTGGSVTAAQAEGCSWLDLGCQAGDAASNAICQNPSRADLPVPAMWPGGTSTLLVGGPSALAEAGTNIALGGWPGQTNVADRMDLSKKYTALEWYGAAGTTWDSYTWSEVGGGCAALNNAGAILPNIIFELNRSLSVFTGNVIGWLSTVNIIDAMFLAPGALFPRLMDVLKSALFLNYLTPLVLISSLWLLWRGIVQKRTREALQGTLWIFAAATAALAFMLNPVWFARTLDGATNTVTAWTISSATNATTFGASSRCGLGALADDGSVTVSGSEGMRTIKCSLWDTFVYTPWAAGQIGPASTENISVKGVDAKSTNSSTFRGDNSLSMMVLDSRTFNFADVASAVENESGWSTSDLEALNTKKKAQWTAIGDTIINNPEMVGSTGYWTGNEVGGRFGIALVALGGQLAAVIPLLVLAFGMLSQQVVFLFLMLLAPFFLTIGIHPGFGRRIALGWLEMVLATFVKRIALAVMMSVLLAFFAAVMASTAEGSASVMLAFGWQSRVLLLITGAIVVLIMRGKVLKQAGSFIELDGIKPSDDGKGKALLAATGMAVAGGLGNVKAGGTFLEGAQRNWNGPNLPGTRYTKAYKKESVTGGGGQQMPGSTEPSDAPRSSRRGGPAPTTVPAGDGTGSTGTVPAASTPATVEAQRRADASADRTARAAEREARAATRTADQAERTAEETAEFRRAQAIRNNRGGGSPRRPSQSSSSDTDI